MMVKMLPAIRSGLGNGKAGTNPLARHQQLHGCASRGRRRAEVAPIRARDVIALALAFAVALSGCGGTTPPTPQVATITVTFDMGGGGSGFAATIYAQEVATGKTFKSFYPAGSHGLVILPTSPPVSFTVEAPGTYVFYATLIEAPDDYQYGATSCGPASPCPNSVLKAIDVEPGGAYQVYVADRAAPIPTPGSPVTVPWER